MWGSCICWTWALWFFSKKEQCQIKSIISRENLYKIPVCSSGRKARDLLFWLSGKIVCLGQCRACLQGRGQQEAIIESLRVEKILQEDEVYLFFEHFQGWWFSHLTGEPVPMPYSTFSEEIFPDTQPETPLAQLVAISLIVRLVACEKRPTYNILLGSCREQLSYSWALFFLQAKHSQLLLIRIMLQPLPQLLCLSLHLLQHLSVFLSWGSRTEQGFGVRENGFKKFLSLLLTKCRCTYKPGLISLGNVSNAPHELGDCSGGLISSTLVPVCALVLYIAREIFVCIVFSAFFSAQ